MTVDAWLEELYERDYALLYRVGHVFLGSNAAQETLIEDQIQEAFVRAWQKRAVLQKHPNPDGWLVDCFRNCLMNACKKQSREWKHHAFSVDAENAQPLADKVHLSPDDYARTKEQIDLLRRLLGDENADIFLRYCVYGEKASKIAAELNISDQALRMRISRLKKKILSNRTLFSCLVALCLLGLR
ncbi:MAG: sigma-70 family RNA polymerase sigma factor [Clostridia bacterium]|nr:sigma-70 family RNA polymerase sigma factor [Clostridia bacterium]